MTAPAAPGVLGTAAGPGPAAVRWHSRKVAYLKLMLPAVALAIVTLVLAWPQLRSDDARLSRRSARAAAEDGQSLRVLNARYVGTDDQQHPFMVTASSATQAGQNAPTVDLVDPKADTTLSSGAWTSTTADTGVYDQKARILDLAGHVVLYHDSGLEFHTARSRVELGTGRASGDDPVQGQGPAGTIESEGFRVIDRGASILFTGKAHAVLNASGRGHP